MNQSINTDSKNSKEPQQKYRPVKNIRLCEASQEELILMRTVP